VRAWIETLSADSLELSVRVARRVRAWIETVRITDSGNQQMSPAVCGRGLKPLQDVRGRRQKRRPPCAGVD